jgi:hypothetical protein
MEKYSELFIRAALHDLANVLAGVRGIVDLTAQDQPLSPRDRSRLEAVLDEGTITLDRCRHLAMGTFPSNLLEAGEDWRDQLREDLAPLGVLFRSRIELRFEGAPAADHWPGSLLRGFVHAVTRQALPFTRNGTLTLLCSAAEQEWQIHWSPAAARPESLAPGPEGTSRDICSRWTLACASALGADLAWTDGALRARIPRVARVT